MAEHMIRNTDDALHEALKAEAARRGTTLTDLAAEFLWAGLGVASRPKGDRRQGERRGSTECRTTS